MNERFEKIKKLILDYEENKIESDYALSEINSLANTHIDREWLDSYRNSLDLDDFVKLISIKPIEKWRELDDKESLELIFEILHTNDDSVKSRNIEAIEKRYSKPEGKVYEWIFHENITEPEEILRRLKINTSIAL